MKNHKLVFSGMFMSLAGITLLLSQSIGVQISKILVPVFFIVGGYFSYAFSRDSEKPAGRQFHLLQAFGMLLFGILVATIPDSLTSFLTYVTYFIMCFVFLEIGFGLMSLSGTDKVRMNIVLFRLLLGFLSIIGAMVLLFNITNDPMHGLMIAGALMIFGGVAFTAFAQKI